MPDDKKEAKVRYKACSCVKEPAEVVIDWTRFDALWNYDYKVSRNIDHKWQRVDYHAFRSNLLAKTFVHEAFSDLD